MQINNMQIKPIKVKASIKALIKAIKAIKLIREIKTMLLTCIKVIIGPHLTQTISIHSQSQNYKPKEQKDYQSLTITTKTFIPN